MSWKKTPDMYISVCHAKCNFFQYCIEFIGEDHLFCWHPPPKLLVVTFKTILLRRVGTMAKYGKEAGKEEYTLGHLHPALSAEDKALGWMNSLSGDMRCDPSRNIHFVPFRSVAWGCLLVTFHELKTEPSLWDDGLGISLLSTWKQDRKRSITLSYPHSLGFYKSVRLTPPTTGNRSNNTNQKK